MRCQQARAHERARFWARNPKSIRSTPKMLFEQTGPRSLSSPGPPKFREVKKFQARKLSEVLTEALSELFRIWAPSLWALS